MILTCRNYNKIIFPVFGLHSKIVFYTDDLILAHNDKIIDNKNVDKETLAARRLHSPLKNLYKFKNTSRDFIELIKNDTCPLYLDSTGAMFVYKKTTSARIETKRITKVAERCVWLQECTYPIMVRTIPPINTQVCQALIIDKYPIGIWSWERSSKMTRKFI